MQGGIGKFGVGAVIYAVNDAVAICGKALRRFSVHVVHRRGMPAAVKLQNDPLRGFLRRQFFHLHAAVYFFGKNKALGRLIRAVFQRDRTRQRGKSLSVRICIDPDRRTHDRRAQGDHSSFSLSFMFFTSGSMIKPIKTPDLI